MSEEKSSILEGITSRTIKTTDAAKNVRKLTKKISNDAHQAAAEGRPIAYCFIMSLYDEILRSMDITPIWTENYAAICAVKRKAEQFIAKAESDGYPRNLCTYCTINVGFDACREEQGGIPTDSPDGGMEKPTVMLGTGMMICDPRYKSYQIAQRYNDVPVYVHGLLWPAADVNVSEVQDYYVKYITEELRGLVDFLEKNTGQKMDWDRLDNTIDLANKTYQVWYDAYQLRKAVPAPMPSEDAFNTMVPGYFMMGTQEAYDFYKALYDEVKYRVDNKMGVIPDEKYRIVWASGLPPWFALAILNYFESKGAVFPIETTYHPPPPVEIPSSAKHPLERLAWRFFKQWTSRHEKAQKRSGEPIIEQILDMIDDYKIDGIVAHRASTCRTIHVGQIHMLNVLKD
ncbi:MAG: 2-hydroxyacyl-CoA dehydratase family protein, partial [Spirochaetota bacterium]|nr:2-hydroxyacyl-CoA dehydratase family protein [Spirochaetota bacterium]